MADYQRAEDVLPNRGHWPRIGATTALLSAILAVGVSPSALAATTTPATVTVTVSGPTTTISTRVPGTTRSAWLQTRTGVARMSVRHGYAIKSLPSTSIVIGESVIEIRTKDSSVVTRVRIVARRATRVSAPIVSATPEATSVSGIVSHYDVMTGALTGDSLSPVWVQERTSGSWRTIRTATTTRTGGFTVKLPLVPGRHVLRLTRPVGATVAGGVGVAVTIDVPMRSARGDVYPSR